MKLALGTVQFGMDYGINSLNGQVQKDEVTSILNYASEICINMIDTAPSYGDCEQIIGSNNLLNFSVVSKTRHYDNPVITANDVELMCNDFNKSLTRLNKNFIYGLLIHNSNDLLKKGSDQLFNQLENFKQNGLIKKIGISAYTESQIQAVVDRFDIDLIQIPFNIIDRRLIDSGILNELQKKGIEIHARSIFLQGLLLMTSNNLPSKFNQWRYLWKIWEEWLLENNITAIEASVRYAISVPEISKVIVGVDSKNQLEQIYNASKGAIPQIPEKFFTNDPNILNPSNWSKL